MTQRALDAPAPPSARPAAPPALPATTGARVFDDEAPGAGLRARARVRAPGGSAWVWAAGTIALLALSAALVVWARTLPSFDAYGWLAWGLRTWHGGLNTNAAPSWKPLPYLFTAAYGVLGRHLELRLWMLTSAAIGLAGVVLAARLAWRLTGAPAGRRLAGWVAALFAGAALLGIRDELGYGYLHYVLSSQTDPMIVTFVLGAIDLQLSGRRRTALGCWLLASLGRPEAWPFLALSSWWLWRAAGRRAAERWLVAGCWAALAALWFGIPALTSRTPFVAAANALDSGRAPGGDRVTTVLSRFEDLQPWPVYAAAAVCVAIAAWRIFCAQQLITANRPRQISGAGRDRATLALAGGIVVWVAIEIAFGLHGWPALGRYMFEPAAVATVLAGAFAGRTLAGVFAGRATASSRRARVAAVAGPALVAALVAGIVPSAISAVAAERSDLAEQHARSAEIEALPGVVARLGGTGLLRSCGEPLTRLQYQTAVAYALGDNVSQVGFKYSRALAHGNPVLFVTPFESGVGWQVQAAHQAAPRCRALPATPTDL